MHGPMNVKYTKTSSKHHTNNFMSVNSTLNFLVCQGLEDNEVISKTNKKYSL